MQELTTNERQYLYLKKRLKRLIAQYRRSADLVDIGEVAEELNDLLDETEKQL